MEEMVRSASLASVKCRSVKKQKGFGSSFRTDQDVQQQESVLEKRNGFSKLESAVHKSAHMTGAHGSICRRVVLNQHTWVSVFVQGLKTICGCGHFQSAQWFKVFIMHGNKERPHGLTMQHIDDVILRSGK